MKIEAGRERERQMQKQRERERRDEAKHRIYDFKFFEKKKTPAKARRKIRHTINRHKIDINLQI